MKRFFLSIVLASTFALSSCQFDDTAIWDKLENHEKRIAALEELCKQMNTNISALQNLVNALEKRDYITNVSPISKDGKVVGYTISFAYSDTITIYHGEDGQNGTDGIDGYTPQIGVMEDTDGVYYWTLDGEWLLDDNGNKIKAVGSDGADGKDGIDGDDGKDGEDGKDGSNGITPRLKIDNDYWYVSYDNGTTWQQLGKATGEDGEDGIDGESLIESIDIDDNTVTFILTNGQVITIPLGDKRENNKIYYTTTDGKKLFPYNTDPNVWGAILVSNTYENGQGVMTFDDTITSIGDYAFSGCSNLKNITLPDSVTYIGDAAFENCSSLEKSITIPDSVTYIGDAAFENCSSLTSIIIPESITKIGSGAFSNCSSLENITIPNCAIGVQTVYGCTGELIINNKIIEKDYNDLRFFYGELKQAVWHYGSNFSSIIIGEDVTKIGIAAFYGYSSLASITIPDSVTEIGGSAFRNCWNLTSIYCKSTTPPKCYDNSLAYGGSDLTIYVPTESVDKYQTADVWQHYASNIVGYDF